MGGVGGEWEVRVAPRGTSGWEREHGGCVETNWEHVMTGGLDTQEDTFASSAVPDCYCYIPVAVAYCLLLLAYCLLFRT